MHCGCRHGKRPPAAAPLPAECYSCVVGVQPYQAGGAIGPARAPIVVVVVTQADNETEASNLELVTVHQMRPGCTPQHHSAARHD